MATLQLRRLSRSLIQRSLVRSIVNSAIQPNTQQSHIYKKKYTKEELLAYLSDNVVHTCDEYIVTSVPQGIKAFTYDNWSDSETDLVCNACLYNLIPDFYTIFNHEPIFICKSPNRNASGLLVLSKKMATYKRFKWYLAAACSSFEKIYRYLAVVVGSPVEVMTKTFGVQPMLSDSIRFTRISDESAFVEANCRSKYEHKVIDSVGDFSLVKIKVSFDARDSVRHILAQKCYTPVLGDSWSVKRAVNFLFGAPIANVPSHTKPSLPYELNSLALEKLQLTPGDQKCIPIHCHLYGMKWPSKRNEDFFVSVPPPESFTWTCRQLGLNEIEQFVKREEQSPPL